MVPRAPPKLVPALQDNLPGIQGSTSSGGAPTSPGGDIPICSRNLTHNRAKFTSGVGVGDFSNIKLADHPLPDPSGGEAIINNKRSRRSTQSSVATPRRAHSLCKAWDKLGLDLSEDLLDGQVLSASQDTEEPDEQVVCNPFGTEVQTSVGIPPACAHAAV